MLFASELEPGENDILFNMAASSEVGEGGWVGRGWIGKTEQFVPRIRFPGPPSQSTTNWQFKCWKCIISWFLKLTVQDKGVGSVSSF